MDKIKQPKSDRDIVTVFETLIADAFESLFEELSPEDTEREISTILEEEGYVLGELGARMQRLVDQALRSSPLNWRVQAQAAQEKNQTRGAALRARLPAGREALATLAQQLLSQTSVPLAAHFRNYESMSEDDLASFVIDLQQLIEDEQTRRDGDKTL